ncbi:MAG: cytochrome c biogenesis protein CcdA [Deltaproteobacteria bacterium]|jgi:cytochrome c-type biogenesis protein|nr:cytochrome c biogenesis protein CcdA [Deltaproteobacteria bacterium]
MIFQHVGLLTAFLAGIAMFFSPCTLPLLPGWLAAVTGRDYREFLGEGDGPGGAVRLHVLASTLCFVLGFTLVFTLLGAAASVVGDFLYRHAFALRLIGGLVMILFALVLLGVLKPKAMLKERRLALAGERAGYLGAFLIGIAFAAGWTPCSGPILASIMSLAMTEKGFHGVRLLLVFSAGLALPFLVVSLFLASVLGWAKRIGPHWTLISRVLGVLFLILAVLLISGKLSLVTPDYAIGG